MKLINLTFSIRRALPLWQPGLAIRLIWEIKPVSDGQAVEDSAAPWKEKKSAMYLDYMAKLGEIPVMVC